MSEPATLVVLFGEDLIHASFQGEIIDADEQVEKTAMQVAWQPIETAPRDGSYVILYGTMVEPNLGYAAEGREPVRQAAVHQGFFSGSSWQTGGLHHWEKVTHWMPLPTAPAHPAPGPGELEKLRKECVELRDQRDGAFKALVLSGEAGWKSVQDRLELRRENERLRELLRRAELIIRIDRPADPQLEKASEDIEPWLVDARAALGDGECDE